LKNREKMKEMLENTGEQQMRDKARKIKKKMKNWKRLNNPARDRILDEFNQSMLDPVGPLGGDQGMKVLHRK
jgi:hypothetical protein